MNVVPLTDPYADELKRFPGTPIASRGQSERRYSEEREGAPKLGIHRARLLAGSAIQPRQWLYGHFLIRRYISVLVAPGGVGKTALTVGIACSAAHGKQLLGEWVHKKLKVLICTLEDPEDELDRRIAAAMLHHGLSAEDLDGQVFVIAGRDRQLRMATLDADGTTVCFPDQDAMAALVQEHGIDVVIVDPFVNSHELDENNNPQVNAAARAWAEIADGGKDEKGNPRPGCSVLLVHHTRKGAEAGDIEGSRGAKALTDACRVGLTLTPMSEEEAKLFGISPQQRRLHVRLDDAKANLAPPSDKAKWFRLASVALENGDDEYPQGDNVQAIERWEPPVLWDQLPSVLLNELLDLIAEGPVRGSLYTDSNRGKTNNRYVLPLIARTLGINDEQAKKVLSKWLETGLLKRSDYHDTNVRKEVPGLHVDNALRPS